MELILTPIDGTLPPDTKPEVGMIVYKLMDGGLLVGFRVTEVLMDRKFLCVPDHRFDLTVAGRC